MSTLVTILIAVLVFGAIVLIHEAGHFTVAKLCKIKVNEFSIGMGPKIISKKLGETAYSIRLLPIGGFVSMEGEDVESSDEGAFCKKPVYQRIAVVVAGALMNILLGFAVIVVAASTGSKLLTRTVGGFKLDNAPSMVSGLMEGDEIININGRHIFTDSDIKYELLNDADGVFTMVVKRNGEKLSIDNIKFQITKNEDGTQSLLFDFYVNDEAKTVLNVLDYSVRETLSTARLVYISLFDLIMGKYGVNDLSGPVGVVGAIGKASRYGLSTLLYFISLITINIGIFNLLPLPALDGGRLVFLLIEAVRRKPINPKYEGMVHAIGLALLMLLMLVVSAGDIIKLFKE